MYVSSRQGYKPPVKSTGRGKKYSHFASLKYCNGAETFYTVSYHAYIPLLKFNNIVMNKIIKLLSSIICFFCFVIHGWIDYFNDFLFFLPNLPESFVTEKKWEKILRKLIKKS
jgi:hypothetical protein